MKYTLPKTNMHTRYLYDQISGVYLYLRRVHFARPFFFFISVENSDRALALVRTADITVRDKVRVIYP